MSGLRALAFAAGAAWALAGLVPAQDSVPDFAREVLPILERRCFRCHKAAETDTSGKVQKPKGGLRLDGRVHFLRGGDGGPVLVPGILEDSEIFLRVTLPADDPDYMPSKGEGLSAEELQIFRRWIASGAGFGDWQGATDAPAAEGSSPPADGVLPTPSRIRTYEILAEGVAQPPQALIEKLARLGALVHPVLAAEDRRLLRVAFPSGSTAIGRDQIAALAGLRGHVAEIDLARTTFDENALFSELARMPRLVRIDLREATIDGSALHRLGDLQHLDVLNLFGCRGVTDDAIQGLSTLTSLSQLHVWQTRISEAGLAELRSALPGTRVVGAPALPTPLPGAESPRRR
ncbi:MAG: hypothetical protein O3C51_09845 [Planctomycetota bacterium]|nr:hypothetical protein [Planctomycetota bacterium]